VQENLDFSKKLMHRLAVRVCHKAIDYSTT